MNQIQKSVQTILNKEVTRKEFLQHVGFGLLAATGVVALIKNLQFPSGAKNANQGYGASMYGGGTKRF